MSKKNFGIISKLTAAAILVSTINIPFGSNIAKAATTSGSSDQNVHVQLLGINDFHGQLDYSTKVGGKPVGGIQYLAGYLKERKATNPNTLMVEAGDLFGASRPVSALLNDEPTVRYMNELGFDVGTLGNHEFDKGVTELKRMIKGGSNPKTQKYEAEYGKYTGANFPIVCANVVDEKTGQPLLNPYVIKEVGGVKIGFIGVVTTETPSIVAPSGTAGVKFIDEVEAINKYAAELKAKGIKAIVVLAHDPGKSAFDGSNPTGKLVDIAKAVDPEVDVIYGAHDHAYMNSTVNGKLLVQSYSYGTAFSDVNLTIDPVTQDIVDKKAEIVTTFQNPEHLDAGIKAELDKYEADIAPITSQVVGKATTDITRTTSPAGENAMGNLIADAMLDAGKTDFAFMNAGGIRNDLGKGTITWGTLFGIQPFGNDIVKLNLTGDQVRALLNQQWTASSTKIMQIAGLTYTWDSKFPVGQKVLDIFLPNGDKIDPNKVYSVTVNNFMADGGDGFTVLKQGTKRVTITNDLNAFISYIKAQTRPIYSAIEDRISVTDTIAPILDAVNDQATKVTGTTEAGANVEVTANGASLGTAAADKDGKFAIAIPAQTAGTELSVSAKDADGTVNTTKATVTVTDVTPPAAPTTDVVTDKSLTVTGKTEAGAKVEVKADGVSLGTVAADKDGKFSLAISVLKAGTELSVTATDAAGNVSAAAKINVIKVTAPAKPEIHEVNDTDKKVTGTAAAGSTVTVKAGSKVLGSVDVDVNGKFAVKLPSAIKAGSVLSVTVKDAANNVSEVTFVRVKDKTAPQAPKVSPVTTKSTKVTGSGEIASSVYVKAGNKVIGKGLVDKFGRFSITISKQKAGTALSIIAVDRSFNVSNVTKVIVNKK